MFRRIIAWMELGAFYFRLVMRKIKEKIFKVTPKVANKTKVGLT